MERPTDHTNNDRDERRRAPRPEPTTSARGKRQDPAPERSPAEARTDLALDLLERLLSCSDEGLAALGETLAKRASFRSMFPESDARGVVEDAVRLASGFDAAGPDARERLEQGEVFLVVRACKARMPGSEREDAPLAQRCLGPLLAFVAAVLRDSPSLAPDAVRRRSLVKSLGARLPEVWSRTKRAQGESVLHMAYRASLRTRVRLLRPGTPEHDEDVASIALALVRLERDQVIALPQVAIGELLDAPHQRISESIGRLVKIKFLTPVGEHDRKLRLAKTYRVRSRKTEGIFQVYDRQ